jgi:hypothetical protein
VDRESLLPALEQFKQFLEALISGSSAGHQVKVRLTIANWISPPTLAINKQPADFEFVRFD